VNCKGLYVLNVRATNIDVTFSYFNIVNNSLSSGLIAISMASTVTFNHFIFYKNAAPKWNANIFPANSLITILNSFFFGEALPVTQSIIFDGLVTTDQIGLHYISSFEVRKCHTISEYFTSLPGRKVIKLIL
jgi:hypothetical protein